MVLILSGCQNQKRTDPIIKESFEAAAPLYDSLLQVTENNFTDYPHSLNPDGSLKFLQIDEWTGGFWPGILWYMYEYTKENHWKEKARKWTESLESNQYNTAHHDIGFMMFCSYGNALRFEDNARYRDILIQSARSLCERYSDTVKCIQSWNSRKSKGDKNVWEYPVIMDNMMNLELLFYAAKETKDSSFRNIAINHALQTLENHIRPDYSSYHVVNYDPKTGKVLHKQTLQGFSDQSTWARGQAWGIYGFTMTYRETEDTRFLKTAEGMADFFINHSRLPSDHIPFWDFDAGVEGYVPDWDYRPQQFAEIPRDASAAAIAASALIELSNLTNDINKKETYKKTAVNILRTLASDRYRNIQGDNPYFLLKHSTGNLPSNNEVDVPLIYADYYYLEALLRYNKQLDKEKT